MTKKRASPPFYSEEHSSWAIPLTQGVIALVDEDVAQALGQFYWSARDCNGIRWYATRSSSAENGWKRILMHKEILPTDGDLDIDHRHHYDKSDLLVDNRRANLRVGTRMQNMQNADIRRDNQSGFKGVTWDASRGKWAASLMINYKRKALGRYSDKIEAAKAYDRAALEHFGEFAKTNAHLGLYQSQAA